MKKLVGGILFSMLALSSGTMALAAEKATPEEAIALVRKATAYWQKNGREKAIATFNAPSGQFTDRELYIVVLDSNGVALAHPNAKIIGKSLLAVKDADGNSPVERYLEVARQKGKGWTDYKWPNPTSGKIEHKSTYVEKFDDVVFGCGIYK